jgi:hypothetical protein
MRNVLVSLMLALLAAFSHNCSALEMRIQKKLVATGWDHSDSQTLLNNLEQMEKRPFDGVVIYLTGRTTEDKPCQLHQSFVNQKWERQWFQLCIDQLKGCKFKQFTDNFILFGANPGDVDWFDDEGWQNIVEHWRIAAWAAKQSGMRGILFDPEPYTEPYSQFRYDAQPGRRQHSFDDYYAKARQRGREVMKAVAQEYPDITIFCYFMNSINAAATGNPDPRSVLATMGYGLYPAFIDGWLDVTPPTIIFVDGCESAYLYNSRQQFLESAVLIRGACQEMVSPENRARYRSQVQVGFGIYLDAYWNPAGPWYIDGLGGPRIERLRANVTTALNTADQYVWIYGEKFRWWPTANKGVREQSWPDALPGCDQILHFTRDPIGYARRQIAEANQAGNLTRNGDFSLDTLKSEDGAELKWKEGGSPVGWGSWQQEDSHGTFTWDRKQGAKSSGAAKANNISHGCFTQEHNLPKSDKGRYALRAVRKLQGEGDAWIRIRWKTAEDRWTAETHDKLILCEGPRDQWSEMLGVAEVPEGAGKLVILLGASGRHSPEDTVWYDDVELYRLP